MSTIASTGDTSIRNPLISEVVTEIHDNLPLVTVVWYQHTVSVADGLQGVVILSARVALQRPLTIKDAVSHGKTGLYFGHEIFESLISCYTWLRA